MKGKDRKELKISDMDDWEEDDDAFKSGSEGEKVTWLIDGLIKLNFISFDWLIGSVTVGPDCLYPDPHPQNLINPDPDQ